jgi:hypothetical protein
MRIIVIGCPRSGFRYIARVFTEAGLPVGHEHWRECGRADYTMTPQKMPVDALVLHQMRKPLDVIGSMQTIQDRSWELLMKHTSANKTHDLIERGMRAYLEWNRIAEAKADYSYRVEDLDDVWDFITSRNMLDIDEPLPDVRRNLNTRKGRYKPLEWEDLEERNLELTEKIVEYYVGLGEGRIL